MKKTTALLVLLLSGAAIASPFPEMFQCTTTDSSAPIRISGHFTVNSMTGTGKLELDLGPQGGRITAERVTYQKGMWMTNRMNAYLRDAEGNVLAGIMVDEYFAQTSSQPTAGTLYGVFGERRLECRRFTSTW